MQQVISAKWTHDEIELMDQLLGSTGATSRSQLLRVALLNLAEGHKVSAGLIRKACQSRLDHPYRRTSRGVRLAVRSTGAKGKQVR